MSDRRQILIDAFGREFPVLWCLVVTHYAPDGTIDTAAMRRRSFARKRSAVTNGLSDFIEYRLGSEG